jgi:hypothetical protein
MRTEEEIRAIQAFANITGLDFVDDESKPFSEVWANHIRFLENMTADVVRVGRIALNDKEKVKDGVK